MEPLFALLIFAAIALVKWLSSRDRDEPDEPEAARPGGNSEEERMRRFMEALGVPKGSVPPISRKASPRPLTRREVVEQQRALIPRAPATPQAHPLPSSPTPLQSVPATPSAAPKIPEPVWESAAIVAADMATPRSRGDLRLLLKSAAGLRDAMVLREILGAPPGLQSRR